MKSVHVFKNLCMATTAVAITASVFAAPAEPAESPRVLKWRAMDQSHHGDLQAMLAMVENAPAIPQVRFNRSGRELMDVLIEAGRFDELGLTEAEGWTLVQAVCRKLGLPIEPIVQNIEPGVGDGQLGIEGGPADTPDFRAATEFENLHSILMRWPYDWGSQRDEYADMVDALFQGGVNAAIWTNNTSQRDTAIDYLQNRGVPTSHITWIVEQTNSVWIRDYGPNFLYQIGGNGWGVADFHYYNSRSADDDTPLVIANAMHVPVMDRQFNNVVYTEGGNLLQDGLGCVLYSERTYNQNNGVPHAELDARILTAFNAHKGIVPEDPSLDGTGHVDMFLKVMDEDTILVSEYDPNEKDYQILEDAATLFMGETNGAGTPWDVHRIWQPDVYYVLFIFPVVRTYTNAMMANDTVILPVYDIPYDATAVSIFETLLPGRTIIPVNAEVIIESAGAWHCVTMEYPDPTN